MNIKEILSKDHVFAVVGASNEKEKYGFRVYNFLKSSGLEVYPVNPNRDEVQGDKTFNTLSDLPKIPDVVSIITPPKISEKIVDEAIKLGIKTVWFQPGAESTTAVQNAESNGLNTIHDQCILVEGRKI